MKKMVIRWLGLDQERVTYKEAPEPNCEKEGHAPGRAKQWIKEDGSIVTAPRCTRCGALIE